MITIDGYAIDAALTEEHTFDSEATQFPVEDGADITDHVRELPTVVTLECVVSDTPIGKAAVARAGVQALIEEGLIEPTTPSGDALAKLLAVRAAREPVTIVTGLRLYENMVLESLSIPREARTGAALRFTATFREVRIVSNLRTRVRVAVPAGSRRRNLGNKSAGVFSGTPMYRCLEDREVFVAAEDVAAAQATNRDANDQVWTDYYSLPITVGGKHYNTRVTVCLRKERVGYDSKANGGRGVFVKADGKTPLSQDELDEMNADLERQANIDYGPNMKGPPVDMKSNRYVKYVDRPSPPGGPIERPAGYQPNSSGTPDPNFKPIRPWWER